GSLPDCMRTKVPSTVGRSHAERAVRPVAVHCGQGRWPVALLGHRAHQPWKIRRILAVREGKPALGGGCRRRDHRSRSSRSPDPSNSPPDNAHTVLNDEKCRPQIIEGPPGRPATKLLATLPGPDESPSLKHRRVAARKSGRVLNGRGPAPELRLRRYRTHPAGHGT